MELGVDEDEDGREVDGVRSKVNVFAEGSYECNGRRKENVNGKDPASVMRLSSCCPSSSQRNLKKVMSLGRLSRSETSVIALSLPDDERKAKGDRLPMEKILLATKAEVNDDSCTAVPESIGISSLSKAIMSETGWLSVRE